MELSYEASEPASKRAERELKLVSAAKGLHLRFTKINFIINRLHYKTKAIKVERPNYTPSSAVFIVNQYCTKELKIK